MEWISVKDRLPEEGKLVLAFEPGERMRVDYIINFPAETPEFIWSNVRDDNNSKTTHWMLLPEPPQ